MQIIYVCNQAFLRQKGRGGGGERDYFDELAVNVYRIAVAILIAVPTRAQPFPC